MASTDLQPISQETAFKLLSKSRRRCLLTVLFEEERESVEILGRKVAAMEREKHQRDVTERAYTRVVTSLVHCHIPRLVDHGLVEYDQETNTVTLENTARERFPFRSDQDQFFAAAGG